MNATKVLTLNWILLQEKLGACFLSCVIASALPMSWESFSPIFVHTTICWLLQSYADACVTQV